MGLCNGCKAYLKTKQNKTKQNKTKQNKNRGTWVAQSIKHLTLDSGSGRDLMVHGIKSHVGLCADSEDPAWDWFSLFPLPLPFPSPQNKSIDVSKINKEMKDWVEVSRSDWESCHTFGSARQAHILSGQERLLTLSATRISGRTNCLAALRSTL